MKKTTLVIILAAACCGLFCEIKVAAQTELPPPPKPKPTAEPTPRLSTALAQNLEQMKSGQVPRERREEAYAKLLEGQRHLWQMSRQRTQAAMMAGAKLAKDSLQKAVELDPTLAEGYTALSELVLTTPPNDIEEAILLANLAAKVNPNSYGARRILARLYTIKSRLNGGVLDPNWAQKAVDEWKQIARLDPRSAEAWAFLSEFYNRTDRQSERIDALERWLASATPLETRFYRTVMGMQEELSPENATLKLGAALIKAERSREAVEVLSRAVADDPENAVAIDLLREAIENADAASSAKTIEALRQAVYANPSNLTLVELLADVQVRLGQTGEAVKTLQSTIEKLNQSDKNSAASLQISLGDVYAEAERTSEAIAAYEEALKMRGIDKTALATEEETEFAGRVFGKIISTYKNTNRYAEARAAIDRARLIFDKEDLFADRQLVSLNLETGKRQEALQVIRGMRLRFPSDESLVRLEATVLTDLGKVDEGVTLIRNLLKGKTASAPSALSDDFSNYIFISMLYTQAKRGKEAIEAANLAFNAAESDDRKQIAKLNLATAQHETGDYAASEATLRDILKQMPGNPIALNNLGYFLLERNERFDEALKFIQQALRIDANNPSYLDSLGWAYYKLGKYDEAEKYLKNAIRRSSDSATIYEHLGDVYQKQNKMELAKTAWQKALNLASGAEDTNRIKAKLGRKK
ncbi:MAG TPA: tetratricopeptide repeat protein [Pyrinomonadaceae bacterium]|jgi:tetratricopeptide (TPR) repeat protein